MRQRKQFNQVVKYLNRHGYITTRIASEVLKINSPNEIFRQVRNEQGLLSFRVKTRSGSIIKLFWQDSRKFPAYMKRQGMTRV